MLVIFPADDEPRLETGRLKLGWLNTLKKIRAYLELLAFRHGKTFCTEKSKSV